MAENNEELYNKLRAIVLGMKTPETRDMDLGAYPVECEQGEASLQVPIINTTSLNIGTMLQALQKWRPGTNLYTEVTPSGQMRYTVEVPLQHATRHHHHHSKHQKGHRRKPRPPTPPSTESAMFYIMLLVVSGSLVAYRISTGQAPRLVLDFFA